GSLARLGIREQAASWLPSIAVTLISLVVPVGTELAFTLAHAEDSNHLRIARLALAGAGFGIGWLVGVFTCRHPVAAEITRTLGVIRTRLGQARRRSWLGGE